MALGVCVGWKEDRGFGFIRPDHGGGDIFVHRKTLLGSALWLSQGQQRVEFEVGVCAKTERNEAQNVRAI